MTLRSLNRYQAFAIHLGISAVVATIVVGLVVWLWYPAPYFVAMGGAVLLRLLIGVDVVLGPLITLLIFDPKKPSLKLDLAVIAALQVAALAYGGWVMFDARPVYTVFLDDHFQTVPANSVDSASLARAAPAFRALPLDGPRVVAARLPADAQEKMAVVVGTAMGGPDVAELPHLYLPFAEAQAGAARAARALVSLSQRDKDTADLVSAFVAAQAGAPRSLGYVPVKARNRDFVAVVDRGTGDIVGYLAIVP
jgi:hypothetical protein